MNIGIIGSGNMASALAGGFIASGKVRPDELSMSDRATSKLVPWQNKGVFTTEDNKEVLENSDIVIFAVKPNILPSVLEEAAEYAENKVFVSIAAGFELARIEAVLGRTASIVRAMPNTPAGVRCGMTVIAPNASVKESELKIVENLLSSVGEVIVLDEKYINAATAVHGSGPAYIYMMIDAMADGALKHGIPKDIALRLAAKTAEGAAKMVLESGEHPQKLKDDVCSPGGTTIAAVCELERAGFNAAVGYAIDACVEKADNM